MNACAVKKKILAYKVIIDEVITKKLLVSKRPKILYDSSIYLINAGGKRLRPYLVSKSCEIVGGKKNRAIPFAAALEVLHNFTLVHDDIMDNDDLRRNVQTVHTKWDEPTAITAGDLLCAKVYEAMIKHAPNGMDCGIVLSCIERAADAMIAICEGQTHDLSFPKREKVTEDDYLTMVKGKTATLFKVCAEVGGVVGGGSPTQIEALGQFAYDAGIAFQLVDDYLGIVSNREKLGKPVGSDLREGKKTLIIIHALGHAKPDQKEKILKVLGAEDASLEDVEEVNQLLRDTHSLDYCIEMAREHTRIAKSRLDIFQDSEAKRDLLELVDYLVQRDS